MLSTTAEWLQTGLLDSRRAAWAESAMAGEDKRQRTGPAGARTSVECLNCGRTITLGPESGLDALPLVQLTRRLKCSECGSRAVKAARIETPRDVAKLIRARMGSHRS